MLSFKKDYNFKVIYVVLNVIALLTTPLYSYPASKNTLRVSSSALRPPLYFSEKNEKSITDPGSEGDELLKSYFDNPDNRKNYFESCSKIEINRQTRELKRHKIKYKFSHEGIGPTWQEVFPFIKFTSSRLAPGKPSGFIEINSEGNNYVLLVPLSKTILLYTQDGLVKEMEYPEEGGLNIREEKILNTFFMSAYFRDKTQLRTNMRLLRFENYKSLLRFKRNFSAIALGPSFYPVGKIVDKEKNVIADVFDFGGDEMGINFRTGEGDDVFVKVKHKGSLSLLEIAELLKEERLLSPGFCERINEISVDRIYKYVLRKKYNDFVYDYVSEKWVEKQIIEIIEDFKLKDKIYVCEDKEDMSGRSAEYFVKRLKEEIAKSGKVLVVFPTGRTPEEFYDLLPEYINRIIGKENWEKYISDGAIKFANLDEYVFPVPEDTDPALRKPQTLTEFLENCGKIFGPEITKLSYGYYMKKNVYEKLKIPDSSVDFINALNEDPHKAADEYEKKVFAKARKEGRKIIRVHGIGPAEEENGMHDVHLAFLKRGTPFTQKETCYTELSSAAKKQNEEVFKQIIGSDKIEVPDHTITTGYPDKNDTIIVLASGKEKALSMSLIMNNSPTPDIPATYLHNCKDVMFFVDKDAYSKIEDGILRKEINKRRHLLRSL